MTYFSQIPNPLSTATVKPGSEYTPYNYGYMACDPAKSLTGPSNYNGWRAWALGSIKFNIDCGVGFVPKRLYIENHHDSGTGTGEGVRNILVYGTNSATAFANTTYANTTDLTLLAGIEVPQHAVSNTADPQYFDIPSYDNNEYRYIVLRISNNWGSSVGIGIRRIEVQSSDILDIKGNLHIVNDISMGGHFGIFNDNAPIISGSLMLSIADAQFLSGSLEINVKDAASISGHFEISTGSTDVISGNIEIKYDILSHYISGNIEIKYDLLDKDTIDGFLGIFIPDSKDTYQSGYDPDFSAAISNKNVECSDVDVVFNSGSYVGNCSFGLISDADYQSINSLDEVDINFSGIWFKFLVFNKSLNESVSGPNFKVTCKSPAFIADFPFSDKIDQSIFPIMASSLLEYVANIVNVSSDWSIPADEIIDKDMVDLSSSPLSCLRSVVNEFGGALLSGYDGSLLAVPRKKINPEGIPSQAPNHYIGLDTDIENIEILNFEHNDGYNKFFIFNENLQDGYILEFDRVSDGSGTIRAYKVPWDNIYRDLLTSEHTNVSIRYLGVISREEKQEVEVKNGSGSLEYPYYGMVSIDYKDRDNLGTLQIDENGSIITEIEGNSLIDIKYITKCFCWEVSGNDVEDVQFYLV